MTLNNVMKVVEKFVRDNSPHILTGASVLGTIATAALTGKASYRAASIIKDEENAMPLRLRRDPFTTGEKIGLVWKEFIPAISVGVVTIASTIGANRIGTRRTVAMATALSITERAFTDYRGKVVERLGQKKEQGVLDEIAADRTRENPVSNQVLVLGNGDVLCFDLFTGRYFNSSVDALKKAQNDVNAQIINCMYASLGDFYDHIGLPGTSFSEEVGWNSDKLLDLIFSAIISDDDRPCITIDFRTVPIRDYHHLNYLH